MTAIDLNLLTTDPAPHPLFSEKGVTVDVLRLDKIHPVISGNKWFKLRYYLEEAVSAGKKGLLSFGGAWSNHLVALAAACRAAGLKSTGIIRGEAPPTLSDSLAEMQDLGMELHFLSRADFREGIIPASVQQKDDHLTVPMGGYGLQGARGAAGIASHIPGNGYTHWACAAGTGTMAAGLLQASGETPLIVCSALRNHHGLRADIEALAPGRLNRLHLVDDHHFGGFAKHNPELISFMNEWYGHTGIPSDLVYTAKLFFAITDMTRRDMFPCGSRLLLVHSGGLQGNRSLPKGTLIF